MLTEPAGRLRDRALFAAAALLPAATLGVLGLRALRNEEAAIEREAKVALEASADRLEGAVSAGLAAAIRALPAEGVSAVGLAEAAPAFAQPVLLDEGHTSVRGPSETGGAPPRTPVPARCQEGLRDLAATRDPGARASARRALLGSCAEMRTPGDRWLYPLLVVEGFEREQGEPFAAWLEAHAAWLPSIERAAIRDDIRVLPLEPGPRARIERALADGERAPGTTSLLLREAEVTEALQRGPDATGAITWRAPSSLGAVRRLSDGKLAGFVANRGSLDAALRSPWAALPGDQRAESPPPGGSPSPDLSAARALTPRLSIRVRLADPALLARRTARSRWILVTLAALSTAVAFAIGVLLFTRMRRERRLGALRTDFVAAVSHELRTPIASLLMLAELLEQRRVEEDERDEVHAALAAEARRLGATVDRLLSFARVGAGKRSLVRAWQRVSPIVATSVDVFEARHRGEEKVQLQLDETVEAAVDAEELGVAIDNLLSNARKHAPDGGPYLVRVSAERGGVAITVGDHGPGIPRRDQRRIFEPFERADARLSKATSGSGIGLSLVRHVAAEHGGNVRVDSAPGDTRFTLWLPRGTP